MKFFIDGGGSLHENDPSCSSLSGFIGSREALKLIKYYSFIGMIVLQSQDEI
jgi:hypothetical protein